jgi:predicted O-linked N-acetylglucosamine transferase (SPINDLY family)
MKTISEAIAIAQQSYQSGNLSQAQLLCHQILQQQPNHVEALQLLGIIALQLGSKEAVDYYQQLITLKPDQAETYYYLGAALDQQGQIEDAIAYYQQALALKPDYIDVHYDLGNALKQKGDVSAAIKHYQQAVALNPNDAEAHCNLANTLLEQGQFEAAITHYHHVIALRPHVPGIYYNLGNAFRQQGQIESAITNYRWALVLDPNYIDAYLQLGAVLHYLGQFEEAIAYYQQAIILKPDFAGAYYNLANALLAQGKVAEAIVSYQNTLAVDPQLVDAYIGIGCALIREFRLEEATAYFQQALTLNPDYAEAYHNLGVALVHQSQADEAMDCFQKALQLKPELAEAYWHSQLILPILYDTQEQVRFWRQRFCRGLNNLSKQTALDTSEKRQQVLTGLEKAAFTFYLGYQGFNDRGVQRKYAKFVHRAMSASYPQWISPVPMPPLNNTGKIRIGYLSAHLRENSVANTTLGWLKYADKQRFEIYSYHIGSKADFMTEQFRACSDRFYHIYDNLEAVCQQVIADQLHILVFPAIDMDAWTTQIAALRLAPVQCTTVGHPVTSGLPTVDYFLSSELMEPENGQQHYSERLVCLPNISVCYEKPSVPQLTKTREDFGLREEAIVYLSCQSLFKYLPKFDYIFAKIAQRVPQAQFAFLSSHSTAITAKFKARLSRAFANFGLNSEDYCVVVPQQAHVDYLNLNLVSDIFLDTFSWSGFNSTMEAVACGLPIVTYPGKFMRSRHTYGILKMMGVMETIAQDEAEYVEIAARLGLDVHWRQEMRRKINERQNWIYDDRTCVTALESFYERVVLAIPQKVF